MSENENINPTEHIERLLRETQAKVINDNTQKDITTEAVDIITNPTFNAPDLIDMTPIITYLKDKGIITTYFGGGSTIEGYTSRPYILFPFLKDLSNTLDALEILVRSTQDDDILQALFNPLTESEVGRGESLLHGDKQGFITKGGRVVSFDNTWGIDLDSISYDDIWAPTLRKHGIEPPPPLRANALVWRFAIYFPTHHAAKLSTAARALI